MIQDPSYSSGANLAGESTDDEEFRRKLDRSRHYDREELPRYPVLTDSERAERMERWTKDADFLKKQVEIAVERCLQGEEYRNKLEELFIRDQRRMRRARREDSAGSPATPNRAARTPFSHESTLRTKGVGNPTVRSLS